MLDPENIPHKTVEHDIAKKRYISRRNKERSSRFNIKIDETSATFLFLGIIIGIIAHTLIK